MYCFIKAVLASARINWSKASLKVEETFSICRDALNQLRLTLVSYSMNGKLHIKCSAVRQMDRELYERASALQPGQASASQSEPSWFGSSNDCSWRLMSFSCNMSSLRRRGRNREWILQCRQQIWSSSSAAHIFHRSQSWRRSYQIFPAKSGGCDSKGWSRSNKVQLWQ